MTADQWLTIPEVAARLRVSRVTVYRRITSGELNAHRSGPRNAKGRLNLRVSESDLAAYQAGARLGRPSRSARVA